MMRRNRYARRVAVAASIAVAAGFLAQPGPSGADVTSVAGSAFGYHLDYDNPNQTDVGPRPAVVLPAGGSATPVSSTEATGGAGPVFGSGEITVSTQGTPGPTGSVMSSASLSSVTGTFTAATVASTCTANEAAGASGTTTITGGSVQADNGDDDPTNSIPDHPAVPVAVPTNPPVNHVVDGHLHVPGIGTETFRYIFNEQIVGANSITVNAVHLILGGPVITGDLILGQSVCAITATGATTTTLGTGGTTTTLGTGGTTTTLGTGGTTSTTQAGGGTTSTTLNTGVTTTLPAGGVTTSTILNTVPPAPGPLFGSINVSELIRQIVCPILQQLAADSFLRPFIEPFLVAFGCTA